MFYFIAEFILFHCNETSLLALLTTYVYCLSIKSNDDGSYNRNQAAFTENCYSSPDTLTELQESSPGLGLKSDSSPIFEDLDLDLKANDLDFLDMDMKDEDLDLGL